jgi:hypothetical protein
MLADLVAGAVRGHVVLPPGACPSLREIWSGLAASEGRLWHLAEITKRPNSLTPAPQS